MFVSCKQVSVTASVSAGQQHTKEEMQILCMMSAACLITHSLPRVQIYLRVLLTVAPSVESVTTK